MTFSDILSENEELQVYSSGGRLFSRSSVTAGVIWSLAETASPSSERHQREERTVAAARCVSDSTDLGVKNIAASIFIRSTATLETLLISKTVFTPTPTKQSANVQFHLHFLRG